VDVPHEFAERVARLLYEHRRAQHPLADSVASSELCSHWFSARALT